MTKDEVVSKSLTPRKQPRKNLFVDPIQQRKMLKELERPDSIESNFSNRLEKKRLVKNVVSQDSRRRRKNMKKLSNNEIQNFKKQSTKNVLAPMLAQAYTKKAKES